jgi:membrane fusion protein, multidrug efflux system
MNTYHSVTMKHHKSLIIILITLMISACSNPKEQQQDQASKGKLPVNVHIAMASSFSNRLEFSGTCFANREANVGSSVPGKVEKIHYRPGQFVKQGALLVSMSSEMLVLSEVEFKTLEKDFERVSRLKEKNSISEQDYDHVKAQYEAAKAKYDLMKKNTQILAPFDGVVSDHIVQEGENFMFAPSLDMNFSMTSGIVKLMQINPIIVRFPLNEKLISQVKTGDAATIICDAWPEKTYTGKISLIHPRFNTMTRSTDVEVTVPNSAGDLKPGMFARVYLEGMENAGCGVPLSAIIPRKGKEYVWVEENGKATLKEVQRLAVNKDEAIVNGIEPGDAVIISRKSQLTEGTEVTINN